LAFALIGALEAKVMSFCVPFTWFPPVLNVTEMAATFPSLPDADPTLIATPAACAAAVPNHSAAAVANAPDQAHVRTGLFIVSPLYNNAPPGYAHPPLAWHLDAPSL
jgi:hypothetical protein